MLDNLPEAYVTQAATVLNLLLWSQRRVTLDELVDAVAINLDDDPSFQSRNRMPNPREISKLCSSLVAIIEVDGLSSELVQLAHFSVKEYLLSNHVSVSFRPVLDGKVARSYLAKICLTYVIDVSQILSQGQPIETHDIEGKFPLAHHSASEWIRYAREAGTEDKSLCRLQSSFFHERHEVISFLGTSCLDYNILGGENPLSVASYGGLTWVS